MSGTRVATFVIFTFRGIFERIFLCRTQYLSKSFGAGRDGFISETSNPAPANNLTLSIPPFSFGRKTRMSHFKNPASHNVSDTENSPSFVSPTKFLPIGTESFVIEPSSFIPFAGLPPLLAVRTNRAMSPDLYREPLRSAFNLSEYPLYSTVSAQTSTNEKTKTDKQAETASFKIEFAVFIIFRK